MPPLCGGDEDDCELTQRDEDGSDDTDSEEEHGTLLWRQPHYRGFASYENQTSNSKYDVADEPSTAEHLNDLIELCEHGEAVMWPKGICLQAAQAARQFRDTLPGSTQYPNTLLQPASVPKLNAVVSS